MFEYPREFITNITNLYGETGKAWLLELPNIIEGVCHYWNLVELKPVENMTYHYVAKATLGKNKPMVIKIGFDKKSLLDERNALNYFNGDASIRLFDFNMAYNALLLEQAISGISLKSYYPHQIDFVMDSYVTTMKQLHKKSFLNNNNYHHIRDWLKAIDTIKSKLIANELSQKALILKNKLLGTIAQPIFLHGDLHHDNILQMGRSWVTIDPKGIVGDAEFEIAAFDFIHPSELESQLDIKYLFEKRIDTLAEKAKLDKNRIKEWVFVRLILSATWSIEDNADPSRAILLASIISDLI